MPFLVEQTSRAHLTRISEIMKSDLDWSWIRVTSLLSRECELVGKWSEGCSCHDRQVSSLSLPSASVEAISDVTGEGEELVAVDSLAVPRPKRRRRSVMDVEADACPHKCCRAPELACGKPLELLESVMKEDEVHFNQSMSLAPGLHLTSLLSA